MITVLFTFFGKLPGQTTADFAAEVKQLSSEEIVELVSMINALRENQA